MAKTVKSCDFNGTIASKVFEMLNPSYVRVKINVPFYGRVIVTDVEPKNLTYPEGWYYAFFYYESMVTLTAAILMFIHAWKNPKKPNGINTACYFIVYGLTRSIMEPLRYQEFILSEGAIPWSFVFSILLFVFGVSLLTYVLLTNVKKEGKLLGSANGDPYGISKFIGDTKDEVAYFDKVNVMCSIYPENFTVKKTDKEKTSDTEENTEEKE